MYKIHDLDRLSTESGSCTSHGIYKSQSDLNITTLQNHPNPLTQFAISNSVSSPRSSPINTDISTPHILSNSFSPISDALESLYNRRSESCKDLLEQIQISYQRHLGIRNYLIALQSQLGSSVEISKAELQFRYDGLISQATALYNEALNVLEKERKDRERRLKEEDQALSYNIDKLSSTYRFLDLKLKTENKAKFVQNYNQAISEAEEALKIWAPEVMLTNEFIHIPIQHFNYTIKPGNTVEDELDTTRKEVGKSIDISYRASPIKLINTSRKETEKQMEITKMAYPVKMKSAKLLNFESLEAKKTVNIVRSKAFIDEKIHQTKQPYKHKCNYISNDLLKSIPDVQVNKENIPDSKEFIGYQSFGPIKSTPFKLPSTENTTLKSPQRDFLTFTPRIQPKPFNLDMSSTVIESSPYTDKTGFYSERTNLRSSTLITERQRIDELVEMNQTIDDRIKKLEEIFSNRGSSLRNSDLLSSTELYAQYSSIKHA